MATRNRKQAALSPGRNMRPVPGAFDGQQGRTTYTHKPMTDSALSAMFNGDHAKLDSNDAPHVGFRRDDDSQRTITVPVRDCDDDASSYGRVMRAHELMHTRVSSEVHFKGHDEYCVFALSLGDASDVKLAVTLAQCAVAVNKGGYENVTEDYVVNSLICQHAPALLGSRYRQAIAVTASVDTGTRMKAYKASEPCNVVLQAHYDDAIKNGMTASAAYCAALHMWAGLMVNMTLALVARGMFMQLSLRDYQRLHGVDMRHLVTYGGECSLTTARSISPHVKALGLMLTAVVAGARWVALHSEAPGACVTLEQVAVAVGQWFGWLSRQRDWTQAQAQQCATSEQRHGVRLNTLRALSNVLSSVAPFFAVRSSSAPSKDNGDDSRGRNTPTLGDDGDIVSAPLPPRVSAPLPDGKPSQAPRYRARDEGDRLGDLSRIASDGCVFESRKSVRAQAGTVLIDGSGSMDLNASELAELVRVCPLGTVYVYDCETPRLVKVAERGRWCGARKLANLNGGTNRADLELAKWLAKQPGPRVWVTDGLWLGKCGSSPKYLADTRLAAQRGRVRLVSTLKAARALFAQGTVR